MQFKTGLKKVRPMTHMPYWSALKMKYAPGVQAVTSVDYLANLPNDLGMMGNDAIGDCVVGETKVSGAGIKHAYRAYYDGPIAILTTKSGKKLAVTPNHAVLTDRGFCRARFLQKGDNLVCASRPQIFPGPVAFGAKVDFDQPPPAISEIFSSHRITGQPIGEIMPVAINFHGDEKFINGNIDVIATDRFLRRKFNTAKRQPNSQHQIGATRELQRHLTGLRATLQTFLCSLTATHGYIGMGGHGAALAYGHSGPTQSLRLFQSPYRMAGSNDSGGKTPLVDSTFARQIVKRLAPHITFNPRREIEIGVFEPAGKSTGLALCSDFQASVNNPPAQRHTTDPGLYRKLFDAVPDLVELDDLVDISFQRFQGHIYDLSCSPHWYSANGIISHNCFWAGQYHHRQVNTLVAGGSIITEPDSIVLGAYSSATGFVQGDASTDQGTDPGEGFAWMMANGLPTSAGTPVKVLGCIEIDPRNIGDVLEAMQYCGGLCIGMTLPQSFINAPTPPLVWDWRAGDADSGDGHEVYLGRADITGQSFGIVSWGVKSYSLTDAMWTRGVNQVTAVITQDWVESTGQTPFGMTIDQLVAEMNAHSSGPIP